MMYLRSKKRNKYRQPNTLIPNQIMEQQKKITLSGNLEEDIQVVQEILGKNDDFMMRRFSIFGQFSAAMFFFSNLVDSSVLNTDVLKPLMSVPDHLSNQKIKAEELFDILMNETLYHCETNQENRVSELIQMLLRGETVIIIGGLKQAFHVDTRMNEKRSITQPETEQIILGPREGYIESIDTNLALLRYRLPTADFRVKTLTIGRLSKTSMAICYLEGITNPIIIEEVERRLSQIDLDIVYDIGYIEQFIEDNTYSPFPQIQTTERPDKTVTNLVEGRVAVLADGSPFALLLPIVFNQLYQTPEDYSNRFLMGNFGRFIRMMALVFALVTPSLYISLISFHPELLPTEFAVAVAGGRAGVPYPAIVEVLLIESAMEVLREATIRLPSQVGGALSIVGVLIVGEAAVSAGFASPITVVVIALTTIGSFATPAYSAAFALRMLRFPLIFLSGIFGLYGIVIGIIFIFNHMMSLRSFGVPYMSPVSPGNLQGWKDVVFRATLWGMFQRPAFLHPRNRRRVSKENAEWVRQNSTRD